MVAAVGSVSGSSGASQNVGGQIAALQRLMTGMQKQMTGLQKQLASTQDLEAKKAIQQQLDAMNMEIQMIQQQIAMLQNQAAHAQTAKSVPAVDPIQQSAKASKKSSDMMIGRIVDTEV
jgi:predicted  nucleic acid-binding Zn-ribbon protein